MRSPFPGMDPYLERYWRDLHHRICTYACDALQEQVRPKLLASLDERLVVETDDGETLRTIIPDVQVVESGGGTALLAGTVVAENEPLVIRFTADEPRHQGFIQITDPADGDRLVTVIEFLSASNKRRGDGQRQYVQKQRECREAGVSLVEIDLLREGSWVLQLPRGNVPRGRRGPYAACVHRGWTGNICELYSMPINRPLHKVRVPLRKGDADAMLDLQGLLSEAYEKGGYEDRIKYHLDADPPLTGDAAAWADELLRKAGRRPPIT